MLAHKETYDDGVMRKRMTNDGWGNPEAVSGADPRGPPQWTMPFPGGGHGRFRHKSGAAGRVTAPDSGLPAVRPCVIVGWGRASRPMNASALRQAPRRRMAMKEHIYTIPVTEAFGEDCECPLCFCRRRLEEEALEYELGAAMMEPDHRIGTNRTGFCPHHLEKLYNMQKNRLPYGLVLDTHMAEQNKAIAELYRKVGDRLAKESQEGVLEATKGRLSGRKPAADGLSADLAALLDRLVPDCAVCSRVAHTMEQFADTVIWLFFREPDFRRKLEDGKGFDPADIRKLLKVAESTLSSHKK